MVLPQDTLYSPVNSSCLWKQSGLGLCEDLSLFGALVSVSENVCFLCESIIKLIFHPWIFNCLILSYFSRRPSPERDYVDVESVLRACAWMGEMCCYGYGFGAWVSGAGGDIKDDCVRWMRWEGGGSLGWRSFCLASAQEKRGFEPIAFSQQPAQHGVLWGQRPQVIRKAQLEPNHCTGF